jgi:hypothetical protein
MPPLRSLWRYLGTFRTNLRTYVHLFIDMPSSLRILRSSDVEGILSHIVPDELLDLMSIVFGTLSANAPSSTSENKQSVIMPHRINVPTAAHTNLIMPARIPPFGTAIKLVSVPTSSDDTRGLPGTTIVMDEDTGSPKAIINARSLTAIRTAAGMIQFLHRMTSSLMIPRFRPCNPPCPRQGSPTTRNPRIRLRRSDSSPPHSPPVPLPVHRSRPNRQSFSQRPRGISSLHSCSAVPGSAILTR